MEIKINKEILTYQETIFFGLTMRQFVCSALAVGTAVGLYALLSRFMGRESVSLICILGAAPLAVAGFFQYNGMKLEDVYKRQTMCWKPVLRPWALPLTSVSPRLCSCSAPSRAALGK